jgi:hypothetical protein
MNRKREGFIFRALGLVFLVSLGSLLLHASHEARRQTLCVSIPNLQVGNKERVVGFEIHIASGRIAALPDIPIGWNVSIDNDPSWNTKIEGSLKVGAAAVAPGFFREFLFIEKDESLDVPFQISGEIVVTEDFATERRIQIGMKDLSIKPTGAQHSGACN